MIIADDNGLRKIQERFANREITYADVSDLLTLIEWHRQEHYAANAAIDEFMQEIGQNEIKTKSWYIYKALGFGFGVIKQKARLLT